MASVISTFLRGLVGVAATILLVAIIWSLYIHRDDVLSSLQPVVGLFGAQHTEPEPGATSEPPPRTTEAPASEATAESTTGSQ